MGRVSGLMVTGGGVTFTILSVLMPRFILFRNVSVVETKLLARAMILVLTVKLCPCRLFRMLVVSRMKSSVAEILKLSHWKPFGQKAMESKKSHNSGKNVLNGPERLN